MLVCELARRCTFGCQKGVKSCLLRITWGRSWGNTWGLRHGLSNSRKDPLAHREFLETSSFYHRLWLVLLPHCLFSSRGWGRHISLLPAKNVSQQRQVTFTLSQVVLFLKIFVFPWSILQSTVWHWGNWLLLRCISCWMRGWAWVSQRCISRMPSNQSPSFLAWDPC